MSEHSLIITCTPRTLNSILDARLRSLLALSRKPGSCRSRRVLLSLFRLILSLTVARPPPRPFIEPRSRLSLPPADSRLDSPSDSRLSTSRYSGRPPAWWAKHGTNLFGLTCTRGHHEQQPHGCRASSVCPDFFTLCNPTFGRLSLGFRGGAIHG